MGTDLMSTSVLKTLVMWVVVVVNGMRQSLIFCREETILQYDSDVGVLRFDCV